MMTRLPMLAVFVVGSSLPANAHPGNSPADDFLTGLIHPFSGIDHLAAMIALGIWAVVMGGRALWLLPTAFLSAMALGGSLANMNMSLPLAEGAILVSALLLSAFAVLRVRFDHRLAVAVTIAFAIAHGHAHGTQLAAHVSALVYGMGFITATAVLHISGILIAHLTSRTEVRAPRTTS